VPLFCEQGGQMEGHFAVAADDCDAGHGPILPPVGQATRQDSVRYRR
jgi:hypothetical protein